MARVAAQRPAYWPEIRALALVAMAVFVYVIGIGILNGTDLVDFDRRRVLGHVHGGTLGWLTLMVFAASLWLFGGETPSPRERRIVRIALTLAVASFVIYVYVFSVTYGNWRPAVGTVAAGAIALFAGWVIYRAREVVLGVPHWGFLAAIGTSVFGGVLGVLLGLEIATGGNYLPDGGEDAHPATMVLGFLVPVSLAMAEWAFTFPKPPGATRLGQMQMLFPFAGGLVLATSLLLDVDALAPVAVLLQVVGVGIFVKRMWPSLRAMNWLEPSSERYGAMAAIGVVWVIGLTTFFVIRHEGDFDLVPTHQLLALDHSQFIGATTNAAFAMLLASSVVRPRRLHQVVFLAVNVGLIGFAIGLLGDVTVLKRIFAPMMGTGLLLGIGLFAWELLRGDTGAPDTETEGRSAAVVE